VNLTRKARMPHRFRPSVHQCLIHPGTFLAPVAVQSVSQSPLGHCLRHRRRDSLFSARVPVDGPPLVSLASQWTTNAEDLDPADRTSPHAAVPEEAISLVRPLSVWIQHAPHSMRRWPFRAPCRIVPDPGTISKRGRSAEQPPLPQRAAHRSAEPAMAQTAAEPQVRAAAVGQSARVKPVDQVADGVPRQPGVWTSSCTPRPPPAECSLARTPVRHMPQPSTAA
jgi:hypothetical protein